jgi:hypothetical protein
MSAAIPPQAGSHPTERNVGRALSIIWVAAAAFYPAEVVGYAVGSDRLANLVWLAVTAGCTYAILQLERVAAIVMVPLVVGGGIAIVVSATLQTSVNMQAVMMVVLPAFVIPGIIGAALLLHSERG